MSLLIMFLVTFLAPSAFWNRAYYRWRQIEAQELEERKRTEEARKEAMKQEKAKIKQEYGALV